MKHDILDISFDVPILFRAMNFNTYTYKATHVCSDSGLRTSMYQIVRIKKSDYAIKNTGKRQLIKRQPFMSHSTTMRNM